MIRPLIEPDARPLRGPGLQVIGTGFGRTGTLSTKHALERLGFGPCHHMEEVLRSPEQLRMWRAISEGADLDWHRVFARFGSCVDFPASTQWRSIAEAFPDAKILHTVRDADRWYDSTVETIYAARDMVPDWMKRHTFAGRYIEMNERLIWDGVLEGAMGDRARAIEVYEAWTADVITSVPPERLLVFEVAQGWEPLCAFLGVPVPDAPFPNVNDKASFQRRTKAVSALTHFGPPVVGLGTLAGVAAALRRTRPRDT